MSSTLTDKKITCFHCGDLCDNENIAIDDKYFCCSGCKFVYELLSESDLDTYYKIEDKPGIKAPDTVFKEHFAYLDSDKIREKLLDFSNDSTGKVSLFIPQIHCSSCIWLLENLNRLNAGILYSRVHFSKKELSITFDQTTISLRQLIELLASIGYEPRITLDDYEVKPKQKKGSSLIVRLAVAGFCFANIMLFSFPEYLATGDEIQSNFKTFFGYLNILLSIPVFFFCATVYFTSAWFGLRQKMINMDVPISLGIFILYARSMYEVITGFGPGYFDSFTGLVFFLLIGKYFQQRTYDSLSFDRDYKSYFPISVKRVNDTGDEIIPISDLQQGDTILVRNNELIPVDSLLLSDHALIDYSFVTGESNLVEKKSADKIYAGGRQAGKSIKLEVLKKVSQSYITQLWNENGFKENRYKSLTNMANRFSKYFTIGIISIALLAALTWMFIDPSKAIFVATTVLIIACPCALALSTPFTLGWAQRILGRNKLYFKDSSDIELMTTIDHIVFDKTGTLTKTNSASIEFIGRNLSVNEKQLVSSLVRHSTHPMSIKINNYLNEQSSNLTLSEYSEIPGSGIKGVIENSVISIGSASWCGISEELQSGDLETRVYLSLNSEFVGYFRVINEYRDGLTDLIKNLKNKFDFTLLSGDNKSELPRLSKIFPTKTAFHFKQSPLDKLKYVEDIQKKGSKVLMFGDGLNDAGALKQADIGIAVTEDVSSFSPASDGILDGGKIKDIFKFITFTEKSISIILVSFAISILYNIVGLGFAVTGLVSPLFAAVLMPLSSITIVLFTTLSTKIAAKRIGLE